MTVSETYAGNIVVVKGGYEFQAKASGALNEGRLVILNNNVTDAITVTQAGSKADNVLGYVDADFEANDLATVYTGGIARLEDSGSGIAIGAKVMPAASGKIQTAASGSDATIIGTALEAITASTFGKIAVQISHTED